MMKMCRPKKIEPDGTIIWHEDKADKVRLNGYCREDVHVERALANYIQPPLSDKELADYHLSEKINDRGVCVDIGLAKQVVTDFDDEKTQACKDLTALTSGEVTAPTQVQRIKKWVAKNWGFLPNLSKETITETLEDREDLPERVRQVLEIRSDLSRAAVSKFSAMLDRQTSGKVCGMFMFRGAGQTGRFSSLGVQLHNLLRKSSPELIPILKSRGIEALRVIGNPVDLLAQMVRPAFMAAPGRTFLIGDYAQIEARIVAWLAGEDIMLEVFKRGGDIYCDFGTRAYHRVITKQDEAERLASKGCVLGLGFGGAEGALARSLKQNGNLVLPEEELTYLVETYRNTYPNIVNFWHDLTDAVLMAMSSRGNIFPVGRVAYMYDGMHLWCRLPSGRVMCYPYAETVEGMYGPEVEYKRGNRYPKQGEPRWPRVRLWYGVLIENLAQAIALDLLMGAMHRTADEYYVRLHVHDEIVGEVPDEKAQAMLPKFLEAMKEVPDWAEGLPIEVEGKTSKRYVK